MVYHIDTNGEKKREMAFLFTCSVRRGFPPRFHAAALRVFRF
jgi:hypothetical protein